MTSYLPSKRLVATIISLIVAVVIISWSAELGHSRSGGQKIGSDIMVHKNSIDEEKDTDSDGLKDWEELLWGTDPSNSDSDDDGTQDGEEVSLGRDPLIPAPDDKIPEKVLNGVTWADEDKKLTRTDILARQLVSSVLAMDRAGQLDKQSILEISDSIVQKADMAMPAKVYEITDLNIIKDASTEQLKSYGNKLGAIAQSYSYLSDENEIVILDKAVRDGDSGVLKKLQGVAGAYKSALESFVIMSVPDGASLSHLSIVNAVSVMSESIYLMGDFFLDPVSALIGINAYQQNIIKLAKASDSLQKYFAAEGIVFNKSEPGYFLFNR